VTNSGSKQEEPEAAVTAARPEPVHNASNPAKLSNNYRLPDIGKAPVIDSKPIGKLEHLPDPPVPDNDEGLRCLSQNEIEDLILKQHQHQLAPKHQSISVKSLDSRQNNVYNSETERQAKVLDRDPNEWNIQVRKCVQLKHSSPLIFLSLSVSKNMILFAIIHEAQFTLTKFLNYLNNIYIAYKYQDMHRLNVDFFT